MTSMFIRETRTHESKRLETVNARPADDIVPSAYLAVTTSTISSIEKFN